MDSITVLTHGERIALEEVAAIAEAEGLSPGFMDEQHLTLNIYSDNRHAFISPLCQIVSFNVATGAEDIGFEPEELDRLRDEEIRAGLLISCHIESLKKIRPLIKAILARWGEFVIFEEFNDRYTLETVGSYKPR